MTHSNDTVRTIKRKLKRGPKLGRKELAAYTLGLMEGMGGKFHHPLHEDKPGEPTCRPPAVPKLIVELLERIPHEEVAKACDAMGSPAFWVGPGFRYRCICGALTYKD